MKSENTKWMSDFDDWIMLFRPRFVAELLVLHWNPSLFWSIIVSEVVYLSKPASQETQRWTIRPADPDVVVHKRAIEPPQSLILKRPRIQSSGDEIFERFPFFFLKNSIHLFCTRRRRREDQRFVFLVEQVWGPTGEASERRRGFKK